MPSIARSASALYTCAPSFPHASPITIFLLPPPCAAPALSPAGTSSPVLLPTRSSRRLRPLPWLAAPAGSIPSLRSRRRHPSAQLLPVHAGATPWVTSHDGAIDGLGSATLLRCCSPLARSLPPAAWPATADGGTMRSRTQHGPSPAAPWAADRPRFPNLLSILTSAQF